MGDHSDNNSTSEWPNNDDEEPELFNELFGETHNDSSEAMEIVNEDSRSSSTTDSISWGCIQEKENASESEDVDKPTELFQQLFGKSDETNLYPDFSEMKTQEADETFVTWDDDDPLPESTWEDSLEVPIKRKNKPKDPYGGVQFQYLTDDERELKDKIDAVNARIQQETKNRKTLRQRQFRMKKKIVALKQALASELQAIANEKAKCAQAEHVAPSTT